MPVAQAQLQRVPHFFMLCCASCLQAKSKMSKAEKAKVKKEKAKTFNQGGSAGAKVAKNSKRWN